MKQVSHTNSIAEVADLIGRADSLLFITGAGLSADSGLPTYRGVGGLYDRFIADSRPFLLNQRSKCD